MSLDILRNASKAELRDQEWLEAAITQLGVYPAYQIPPAGVGVSMFPPELAPYLIAASKLKIRSYAEVGVWVGGSFMITVEYLAHFGLKKALALDITIQDQVHAYAESNSMVSVVESPSTADKAVKALRAAKPDLVLIDGDHSEEGCRADWEIARNIAPYVAIHDVSCSNNPGPGRVWEGIDLPKQEWPDRQGIENGMGLVTVRKDSTENTRMKETT